MATEFRPEDFYGPSQAEANLLGVDDVSPDQAAGAIRDEPFGGIPASIGMRTPDYTAEQANAARQRDVIQTSPPVRNWLSSANPAQVAATKDDLSGLAKIGEAVRNIGAGISQSNQRLMEGGRRFGIAVDEFGIRSGLTPDPTGKIAADIQRRRAEAVALRGLQEDGSYTPGTTFEDVKRAPLASFLPWAIETGLVSAPDMAMSVLALPMYIGLRTGNIGQTRAENNQQTEATVGDLVAAMPAATASAFLERLGTRGIIGLDDAVKGGLRAVPGAVAKGAVKEGVTEGAQSAVENLGESVGTIKGVDEKELADEVIQGALAGAGFGGTVRTATSIPEAMRNRVEFRRNIQAKVAEIDVANVAAAQEQIAESKTFTRSPEVMQQVLANQLGDQTVEVDPEVVVGLMEAGDNPFPMMTDQFQQAAVDGEMVTVPYSQYLAATAGQAFAADLNATTIFREDGTSIEAAKELGEVGAPPAQTPSGDGEAGLAAASLEPRVLPEGTEPSEEGFTRTLAESTRAEVQELVAELKLSELYSTPKAVGSTKSNFERYSSGIEEHLAQAEDRAFERAYRQVKRERGVPWKEAVAQRYAEVEQELADDPVMQAWSALTRGKNPLDVPLDAPFKLDLNDPLSKWALDLGLPRNMFGRDGLDSDVIAKEFGFPDAVQMFTALSQMQSRMGEQSFTQFFKASAQTQANLRTREELGFDVTPEAMRNAASEVMVSPEITDYLAEDLRKFAEANGLPFDKSIMESIAQFRFNQRPIKQVINLRKMEEMLARDGRKLETALLKGDIPTAFKWKQAQFLHALELQTAHKFLKTWKRAGRNIDKWRKKRAVKSIAPEYYDRIQEALANAQVPTKRTATRSDGRIIPSAELQRALGDKTLAEWAATEDNIQYIANDQAPPDMSVEQFQAWWNMLTSIAVTGKHEADPVFHERMDAGVNLGLQLKPNPQVNRAIEAGVVPKKSKLRGMDASNRTVENFVGVIDHGNPLGPMFEFMIKPAVDAANTKDDLIREVWNPIVDKFRAIPKETKALYNKLVPNDTLINPRTGKPMEVKRGHLLVILANMGNQSNMEKLAEGYGTTPEALIEFVNRHITKPEAEYVQFIWDQLTTKLFPLDDANARKQRGYGLERVEAAPLELDVGTLRGGYYPLAYNPLLKLPQPRPDKADVDAIKAFDPYDVIAVPSGATKERTSFTGPILLDMDTILKRHVRDTATRIAYSDFVSDMRRALRDPNFVEMWKTRFGIEYFDQIEPWVRRQVIDGDMPNDLDGPYKFMNWLNRNQTLNVLGGSLSVMVNQIQGSVQVMSELGFARTMDGYITFLTNPKMRKMMYAQSGSMRNRFANINREIRDEYHRTSELDFTAATPAKVYDQLGRWAISTVGWADKWGVSGAAWMGAYKKGLWDFRAEPNPQQMAVDYADKVVRETQGSGRPMDLSALQGNANPFMRLLTFAYTPVQRQYDLIHDTLDDLSKGRFKSGARKFYYLIILAPIVRAFFDGDWPDEEQKEDPKWMAEWLIRNITMGFVGNQWFTRDGATIINRTAQGEYTDLGSTPISRATEAAFRLWQMKEKGNLFNTKAKNFYKTWITALYTFGVTPGGGAQLARGAQFLADVQAKRQKPKNPVDWYEGMRRGKIAE